MTHSDASARTAVLVDDEPDDDLPDAPMPWLRRLCRAAVRHLPASGVGVCVVDDHGVQGLAAASDRLSEQIEELQFVLGEGPCLDAYAARHPVLESDLHTTTRWPGYAPEALDRGVRAVFAFPLQIGAARLGVMDVYRTEPGPLGSRVLSQAMSFADLAVNALLDGQEGSGDDTLGGDLGDALEYRSEIYQAQGMVMVDLGVPLAEALVRLRAHAYATGRGLGAVARDVVAGRLVLEADER